MDKDYQILTVTGSREQVRARMNRWVSYGWDLKDFFIQVVPNPFGGYVMFYDSRLDHWNP